MVTELLKTLTMRIMNDVKNIKVNWNFQRVLMVSENI